MKRSRIIGVICFGLLLLPLLVRDSAGQDSETKKEAQRLVKGIIGRVDRKDPPEKVAEMMKLLGDLAVELREGRAYASKPARVPE